MHTLDYVVLLQVMFNLASGVESTPLSVWEQLKERGIRSAKNARELVGKNAVYESFGRLLEAGYVRRTQLPHPTKPGRKGPVVYEVYDNPAWNPDWLPTSTETKDHEQVKPQVATLPGTPEPVSREAGKTAGQNASRNAGSGNDGSGVPGSGNRRVPAGQNASRVPGSGIASPPHPPEEVTTSSPYPLTDRSGSLPSQREEGEGGFAPKELHAAESFLQQLRPPHHMGAASARKYAPVLLGAMAEQGWPSIFEVDHLLLAREVTRDPEGFKRPSSLVPTRIRDLPRYAIVTGASQGRSATAERCPDHPARYRRGCVDCAMTVPV